MKVLQLIDSLEAGGAERMAVQISNGLVERGIESSLIATRKEGSLKESILSEVNYSFLNRKSTLDFKAIHKLNRFIKKNQINIIHAHSTSFFLGFLMKTMHPKLKLVWHDHFGNSEFLENRPSFALKIASRRFDSIIAVNGALKHWIESHLSFKKIRTLYNFADFDNVISRTKLKGENGKRIVCLANLRPQKDHFNLIQAFEKIYSEYSDWTLHLVGKDFQDDYSQNLKAELNKLNCKEHIFFNGTCQDIQHILNQATIGVLSSKSEGLPLSLLEYGLMGLPVIATDVGDCRKVILSNETGILTEPLNSDALYEGLHELVTDEFKMKELGRNLKKHVALHFGKESFLNKLLSIYDSL